MTTGVLTLTATNPSWTLSVSDAATGTPGHMVAGVVGCRGTPTATVA